MSSIRCTFFSSSLIMPSELALRRAAASVTLEHSLGTDLVFYRKTPQLPQRWSEQRTERRPKQKGGGARRRKSEGHSQELFALLDPQHLLLDAVGAHEAHHADGALLAHAVHAVDGLRLDGPAPALRASAPFT